MAHKPSNDEIKFQSQLNKTALNYYKSLLPNIPLPQDFKHDFINTMDIESSTITDYNLYPSQIESKFCTNIIKSEKMNSFCTTNKHNYIEHTLTETNHIQNPRKKQHQTTSNRCNTKETHKVFKHKNTRAILYVNNEHKSDIIYHSFCKDKLMINLRKYIQKHTKVFVADKQQNNRNIDDLNMFKHNINANIGCLMKFIVPKLKRLHLNKYVYCDLNPDHIWMDFDEDIHKPKRFGIVESLLSCNDNTRYFDTKNGNYIGNIGYNPPEIFVKDKRNVLIKTSFDIWSLGICLLEIINGDHPFIYDLSMEYGEERVKKGSLENVITEGYIDNMVRYNHVLIRSKYKAFRDLLLNMLKVDVEERYTIYDVINHKWYQKYCT